MFRKLDKDLVDLYEKISGRIQILTGINCLKQGLISHVSASLMMSGMVLRLYSATSWLTLTDLLIFFGLLLLYSYSGCIMYRNTEKRIRSQSGQSLKNSNFLRWYQARITCWILFVFFFLSATIYEIGSLSKICIYSIGVFSVSFNYLLSCTPLPPGKSKARKFLDSLAGNPKQTEQENS